MILLKNYVVFFKREYPCLQDWKARSWRVGDGYTIGVLVEVMSGIDVSSAGASVFRMVYFGLTGQDDTYHTEAAEVIQV